jgi:protein-tyrosine phosphatase
MSFIISVIERATNAIMAPLRVLGDKAYDAAVYDQSEINKNEMKRMYPKDKLCEYLTFFGSPTEVYPRIYLGSAYNAASYQTLVSHNIKYVINVTSEISNYYDYLLAYHQIPMRDNNTDSIVEYLDDSFCKIEEFLNNNDGNILVHCYMGASRSATIVAHFISKKTKTDAMTVVTNMKKIRPNINLTEKFFDELSQTVMNY